MASLAVALLLCTAGLAGASDGSCRGTAACGGGSDVAANLLQLASRSSATAGSSLTELPDPRKDRADKMIEKFQGIISELNITIYQCNEGLAHLDSIMDEGPHVINAMVPFVGAPALSCNLERHGLPTHLHPPTTWTERCVFYCGESDCPAALTYMAHAKAKLQEFCGKVEYLQGGALCFVEHNEPLKNYSGCLRIVAPHNEEEFRKLADELDIEERDCDAGVDMLNLSAQGSTPHYVINMMVSAFGDVAKACNLADAVVHDDVPSGHQDACVLYCGEGYCPIALPFLLDKKDALRDRDRCGSLTFIRGGATCFLDKGVDLADPAACRGIVAPGTAGGR